MLSKEMTSPSQPPTIHRRGPAFAEIAARPHPRPSRTNAKTEFGTIAQLYQRIRGLACEVWQITRWLLLKCISHAVYFLRGRTEQSERSIIRIGNAIFRRVYSLKQFRDFESYLLLTECGMQQYFSLLPRDEWLERKYLLDVGSGLGQYSHALLAHGAKKVVGLEYQANKACWAATRYQSCQLEFMTGSAECMPFPDETFDTVFSHTVFEHIGDVQAALHEVRRVLKPNGLALLSYNFFHHRGGHHLFPYIHFPWATWVVRESTLCGFWSEHLARDQRGGGMRFYPAGSKVRSLSEGAEIHLNKLTFDEFEAMLPQAGFQIVRRRPSEELVRLLPILERIPRIRRFLTGTVYYVLQASA